MFVVFWHRVCDIKKCFPLQRRPGEEPKRRQRMRGGHNERQKSGTMQKRVETQYKGQINSPLTPFLLFPFSSISTCSLLPIAILVLSTAHPAKNRDHHPSQRRDHISPPAIVYFLLLSSVLLVPLPQTISSFSFDTYSHPQTYTQWRTHVSMLLSGAKLFKTPKIWQPS